QTAYIALTMGFLGGFSTLSTMNCEAVDMATEGHRGEAAAYLVVTYGSTLGAAALGFALAHAILGS
ncbi:CrcB family protein, partial [Senegalimassilia anaerobia]|uniref:CrcB family protein n=2 Tax=Coriobacteriaceae TaxID=84107 RepID=UPI003A9735D2